MIAGTVYGVVLNDSAQLAAMDSAFRRPPYGRSPTAPVLYIKPRNCVAPGGPVPLPNDLDEVEIAGTAALLFGRDLRRSDDVDARSAIAAACLALDVSAPHADYYRPAIPHRCRDGFLPVGRWAAVPEFAGLDIVTSRNGQEVHRWSLDRLVRPAAALAAELSQFMTLGAGDLLLLGLPGDAPSARAGDMIEVTAEGLPPLRTLIVPETQA